jgi:hypothetical protein
MNRCIVLALLGVTLALAGFGGAQGAEGTQSEKGGPTPKGGTGDAGQGTAGIFRVVTGDPSVSCASNEILVSLVCSAGAPDGSKCPSRAVGLCMRNAAPVDEMRQLSVTADSAMTGHFPNGWAVNRPKAPPTPADESEIGEFREQYDENKVLFAPTIEVSLAPGKSETVELPLAGPSGLSASVRWVGTVNPPDVRLALNGSKLAATGTTYHFAPNRGGSLLSVRTTAAGRATITVTNSSNATMKVRIVFTATNA